MPSHISSLDQDVIRHARVIPLDIVQAKGNGHAGTAVSLTPALYVLFQEFLRHAPRDPKWLGRDRFVLSCGHASLALYLQLWLSGYDLTLADLRKARTIDSRTPGHPELHHTAGVEVTTGPLGQGIANSVGIAMESARLHRLLQTRLFSGRVWCFASDGDLQEGISHEASALAGALSLPNLVLIWDDNRISIDGDTAVTFSEDVPARYRAYGWEVLEITDAEDLEEIRRVFTQATQASGPVFIQLRTRIGHPMPTVGGTAAAHAGAPGSDEIAATKEILGLDPAKNFALPDGLLVHAQQVADRGADLQRSWDAEVAEWRAASPDAGALLNRLIERDATPALAALAQMRDDPQEVATRMASNAALNAIAAELPEIWGGSADLSDSTGAKIVDGESFLSPDVAAAGGRGGGPGGRIVHFGVREHAMAGILNGMALSGLTRPFGSTYFVFADYMRPAVRLAALMQLPATFIWTHDSVAVGEDGPTHQPLEHLWSYRAIPGLDVVRPADWVETADVWRRIITEGTGPTALVLSRQSVPVVAAATSYETGAARGAYVLWEGDPDRTDAIIIATGSEVAVARTAAERLLEMDVAARVVSAPCLEWFTAQPRSYQESVLPPGVTAVVSVEAGSDQGWYRWVGRKGRTVAVRDYGSSGEGSQLLERAGITVEAVITAVLDCKKA